MPESSRRVRPARPQPFLRAERTLSTGARDNGENAAGGFFQQTHKDMQFALEVQAIQAQKAQADAAESAAFAAAPIVWGTIQSANTNAMLLLHLQDWPYY